MTGPMSALVLILALAITLGIGAIVALRNECNRHRAEADRWRRYALGEHHAGDSSSAP